MTVPPYSESRVCLSRAALEDEFETIQQSANLGDQAIGRWTRDEQLNRRLPVGTDTDTPPDHPRKRSQPITRFGKNRLELVDGDTGHQLSLRGHMPRGVEHIDRAHQHPLRQR